MKSSGSLNRMGLKQTVALMEWMRANAPKPDSLGRRRWITTRESVASLASDALGFRVTAANIAYVADLTDITVSFYDSDATSARRAEMAARAAARARISQLKSGAAPMPGNESGSVESLTRRVDDLGRMIERVAAEVSKSSEALLASLAEQEQRIVKLAADFAANAASK